MLLQTLAVAVVASDSEDGGQDGVVWTESREEEVTVTVGAMLLGEMENFLAIK